MTVKYRPTSEDCCVIRNCAEKEAGFGRVEICPSSKTNINDPSIEPHLNVWFVTRDPARADTDLFDNAYAWKDFRRGVELTQTGRGCFDFYVYNIGYHKELQGNVTAFYENRKLVRVEGTSRGVIWSAAK